MISPNILKEIIISNEDFILNKVHRVLERKDIQLPSKLKKVIILYGTRRSGKTFILYHIFRINKENALYLDFEDDRLETFDSGDFERIKDAFFELKPSLLGKTVHFLFDEIQNVEGWQKFCRRVVERENIHIYVSGSSSKVMPFEISTALRGRSWSIRVMPFSFQEYLCSKQIDPDDVKNIYGPNKILVMKLFSEYSTWGGFPEIAVIESEFEKHKIINEYLEAMFFKDLVERYQIKNIVLLEQLMDKLFSSFSQKFSLTAFYKQYKSQFQFSKDLLYRYFSNFVQSMLIHQVKLYSESTYKRNRNPAKIYLIDAGLAKRVTSEDYGRLLENIVFLELHRRGAEIHYFQGKNECDFITRIGTTSWMPIQVTWELGDRNKDREVEGLLEAAESVGAHSGFILTRDIEDQWIQRHVRINVTPVWKWLLEKEISA